MWEVCLRALAIAERLPGLRPLRYLASALRTWPTMTSGIPFVNSVGLDGLQFGRAARQPVRPGDGQHVALAPEGETLGELHPFGGADTRSPKMRSAPAAVRSRFCAASPAA